VNLFHDLGSILIFALIVFVVAYGALVAGNASATIVVTSHPVICA
jgi:hypothetical protein